MIKKIVGIGLSFLIILLLNNTAVFSVPLGKLLNPFSGYATLIKSDELPMGNMIFQGLIDTVNIKWDDLRIPHIQAKNELDLYFMQGYVMAFERLWQMEFQTHAAAGRISEIIGPDALDYDRFQRRIGMVYGAQKTLNAVQKNQKTHQLLQAFTNGINHYISSLSKDEYPLEYKLLDYQPELWTPLKTSLLLKSMAWMLTDRVTDLEYTKILNDYGIETINELFPIARYNNQPIIPYDNSFDFIPLKQKSPEKIYKSKNYKINTSVNANSSLGSNNWVINGNRTLNKYPILANDPHLNLSLPSIWYLMHLQCPTINVMGVTIPGAPGIIIGFNDNISWGVTNGYDDSMDWFDIQFYNSEKENYKYDNQWLKTNYIVENIYIKDSQVFNDTIIYTHHGPVVWDDKYQTADLKTMKENVGLALHWTAHDESNELLTFYLLNKASNYDEFKESLTHYVCPGQNFIYSDINNNIGLFHSGKSPIKWERQGMFISDGTNKIYDWNNYIPFNHRPNVLNPRKGYLSSANQNPTNKNYPYYLSEYFAPSYRASQINIRLDTLYKATIDDMMDIQLDNTSLIAKNILPKLLELVVITEDNVDGMKWLEILNQWDYQYDNMSLASTFFENWRMEIEKNTWLDDFGNELDKYIWPGIDKLEELILNNPNSKWFDNKNTDNIENLIDICNLSYNNVVNKLSQHIDDKYSNLEWGNYRGTDIVHLAKIEEFSKLNLNTSGAEDIINATRKNEGPSWRYVIEMDKPYKIKGIYPGGQSGYPGSIYYDNFVQDWVDGKYYDLIFPNNNNEFKGIELQCIPSN